MTAKQKKAAKTALLTSLGGGASRAAACRGAGVSRSAFYVWLEADTAFRAEVEQAERTLIGTVESTALACALKAEEDSRYQTSLIFFLKARCGWRERNVVENLDLASLSDEELMRIADGEDPAHVLADTRAGGDGASSAAGVGFQQG